MANNTTYVTFDAELEYPRVFERNRDMGNDKVNLDDFDGMYRLAVIVDDATRQRLIKAGIPNTIATYNDKLQAFAADKGLDPEDEITQFKFEKTAEGEKLSARVRMEQQWKSTDDGRWKFELKRKHKNPKFTENQVLGPPNVVDGNRVIDVEGSDGQTYKTYEKWDDEVNIGNGSKGKVKISIYKGRATTIQLESVAVTELVEFENNSVRF